MKKHHAGAITRVRAAHLIMVLALILSLATLMHFDPDGDRLAAPLLAIADGTNPLSVRNHPPTLRFQWTNLELHSNLAKALDAHQHECSVPVATHMFRSGKGQQVPLTINKENRSQNIGLGSDLHVYGFFLLKAMKEGYRLRSTPNLHWAWWDQDQCTGTDSSSLLACYFPNAETSNCTDERFNSSINFNSKSKQSCGPQHGLSTSEERMAVTEYLFSSVSPLVVEEAVHQLTSVFPNGKVPANLITIHVRWGDKKWERDLVPIESFINATKQIVKEKKIRVVNILLCTEDANAVDAFMEQKPKEWNVYFDQFYTKMLPYRAKFYSSVRPNRPENTTYNDIGEISMGLLKGKGGLWTLGSLLVAMEANIFILSTMSNWSRLMNELRKGILDPRCNNCTTMVDVTPDAREC